MLNHRRHCLPPSQIAATIVAASSFAAKFYMSFAFRSKMQGKSAEEVKKIRDSKEFQNASGAQLNDAEYAPWLLATSLYFAATNNSSTAVTVAGTLGAYGTVAYCWGRIGGLPAGVVISGALSRYAAMGATVYALASQ